MQVGAGRTLGLGIATLAVSLGFAAGAEAAKLPKFAVTNISSPPSTGEPGDTFTALGVVENKGKKSGKATVRTSLRPDNVPENGPIPLGMTETAKVKKGDSAEFGVPSEIPEYIEDGTYYMVACATPAKGSGCLVADDQITVTNVPDPPDFQPGARTLGDELFPQIGNGGYDASHYEIELDYTPSTNVFNAGTKTTMTATATQDLSEFSMDFQDIPVSAVTVNGVAADSFEQVDATPAFPAPGTQPMKLVIDPAGDGIVEGTEMTVVVEYDGTPVEITDADDSLEGWIQACYPLDAPQTCDGAFVVGEPIGAQGWFPSNNFPTDKATFDTSITVPADLEAVGIGELVDNSNNGDGTETWEWSEDDPTSTYLTTATNGNFDYTLRNITETLDGQDPAAVRVHRLVGDSGREDDDQHEPRPNRADDELPHRPLRPVPVRLGRRGRRQGGWRRLRARGGDEVRTTRAASRPARPASASRRCSTRSRTSGWATRSRSRTGTTSGSRRDGPSGFRGAGTSRTAPRRTRRARSGTRTTRGRPIRSGTRSRPS